jgi:hypothetical protein
LGIRETRFEQVRIDILQAALEAAEQRPAGRRPRQAVPLQAEVQRLQARVAQLEAELQTALLRAEVAVLLPQVGAIPEKKTTATGQQPKRTRKRS